MTTMEFIRLDQIALSNTEAQVARRQHFDKEALEELAQSIETHGVVQPIVVRYQEEPDHYELVAGERRFLAAKIAELEEVPAVVRELTDEQVIEVQLIENLQRADVHPMQEAEGYHELVHKHGHAIEEIYTKVGKSRSYVYGRMKLLALSTKCRAAFYGGKISASIALMLARIPVEKLQEDALTGLANDWNYRRAAEWIQEKFMLRLAAAPFPAEDPDLAGAGPCGTCPKRTGNQPELFGDVKSADICTDPVCFQAKTRAFGQRQLQKARDAGQPVLAGKDAVKVLGGRHQLHDYTRLDGYLLVGSERWVGNRREKVKATKGAEVTLLQDPVTGQVHKVIRTKDAKKKPATKAPASSSGSGAGNGIWQKAKRETEFRVALFKAVRQMAPLITPTKREIAVAMMKDVMDGDEVLRDVWNEGLPAAKRRSTDQILEKLPEEGLDRALTDILLALDIEVQMYGPRKGAKPERLLAAAAARGIDVKAIRRELEPKKPAKKKPTKKKAA